MKLKKNMNLGNKIFLILISFLFSANFSYSEEKISTSSLLNVEEIKPSFEELEEENENVSLNKNLKEKKNTANIKSSQAILIGLDKIVYLNFFF